MSVPKESKSTKHLPSLKQLAEAAEAAESRFLNSPSNASVVAKLAELPLPTRSPSPGFWPKAGEPVEFKHAGRALLVGNRAVLARYFRETEEVDPDLLLAFLAMLDPSLAAAQAARYEIHSRKRAKNPPCLLDLSLPDIADLLEPAPDQKWEIRFFGPKGKPQKQLEWCTFFRMKTARAERRGTKAAVWEIQQETKGSRAQIFRDYKACEEFLELLEFLIEESAEK